MKKICNYRVIVFCFLAMLFSIASLLVANFNRVYSLILFCFIGIIFAICLFKTKLNKYIFIPIFMLVGFVSTTMFFQINYSNKIETQNVLISGRVKEVKEYGIVIENVKLGVEDINGNVILYTENNECSIGDIVSTRSDIKPITYNYDNSYVNYLYDNNIYHEVSSKNIKVVDKTKLSVSENIKQKTGNLYSNIRDDSKGIAMGMLFGDTSYINEDIKNMLNKTGLNHIFAVSGMHIGFLAGIVLLINKKLKIKRLLNILITSVVLILYNVLCGYSPSMVRATIMMAILLFGNEYGTKNDGLTRLALAGIIILLFKPYSMFTISFALSFVAVFGLIAFTGYFDKLFHNKNNKFVSVISASLSVNFAIFPIVIYYFKCFPILFLPVNLIVLPLLPIIYSFTMVLTIVNLIIPQVNFLLAVDYILIPIKIASIIVDAVSISLVSLVFTKTMVAFFMLAEVVATPYILINKKSKILLFTLFILLGLIFALIQL